MLHSLSSPPQEEREKGYFDDAGNYVEREDKEAAEATDAWLASEEGEQQLSMLQLLACPCATPKEGGGHRHLAGQLGG